MVASMKARLASLPGECVLVFDWYDNVSHKDHELMRRAGVGSTNYNIAINSPLRSRGAILKNKHNYRHMSRMLSTFDMGAAVTIDPHDTGVFGYEDAFVTITRYVLHVVIRGRMWCVFYATIPTCSWLLCSGCGGTSLWTSTICGWSGTQHQPDVHESRLQMPSVAWDARLNWLRHYILPIQQRRGIVPECP